MTLTYRNGVSIGEIVVYTPCLAIAVLLAVRHGFGRSAGFLFMIVFCLARIIGPCMQLATISQPTNISLYSGAAILNNLGVSPLMLSLLGFLSRLLDSIHKSHNTFVDTRILKFIELVITVGIILGIMGGVNAGSAYQTTHTYTPGTLSKAGISLLIVSYVGTVLATIATSFHLSHAEQGMRRLFVAISISLPLLLIRLIYSIISTFTRNKKFNLLEGSVTVFLCVALIEEFIIVIILESVGLTLQKVAKEEHVEGTRQIPSSDSTEYAGGYRAPQQQKQAGGNKVLNIAKKTIIGRIVMAVVPSGGNEDVKMQRHHNVRR
jgi:hypothetical protein